jgi:ribosomal protein L11
MNMFERATRSKYTFATSVGLISVTDLWDLPLTSQRGANLNDVAKEINRVLKSQDEDDFVSMSINAKKTQNEFKLELVKYIISVKQAENSASLEKKTNAMRKEKLLALLAKKNDDALESKTIEEIQREIEALA